MSVNDCRQKENALIVHLLTKRTDRPEALESMQELRGLVLSAGAHVVGEVYQVRPTRHPKYFVGEGKAREIAARMKELHADLVVFDHVLTSIQQKSLEDRIHGKVIDRTRLILDIFAQRARSREGKLQVELAQLNYLLPRLTGKGTSLSRLGGGIGTRGPGETKLEEDRRRIQNRITTCRRSLDKIQRRRKLQRQGRTRGPVPSVSLLGYTNAGKSTLFNRLTRESMISSPRLFSTLDPVVRRFTYPDGRFFFLGDTVGLIKQLPVELKTAFRATLEEAGQADCLCHVIDITSSSQDANIQAVDNILAEIGAAGRPVLKIFNKVDLLPDRRALLAKNQPSRSQAVYISAVTGEGIPALLKALRHILYQHMKLYYLKIPKVDKLAITAFPQWAFVLKRRESLDSHEFKVLAEPKTMLKYLRYIQDRGEGKW